jgi:hypothetical protein
MAISRLDGCRSLIVRPSTRMSPSVIASNPGDGVEQRGLAAAGRADEHQEAALFQLEIDALEDFDLRRSAFSDHQISRKAMGLSFDGARHQSAHEIAAGEDIDEKGGQAAIIAAAMLTLYSTTPVEVLTTLLSATVIGIASPVPA